MKKNVASQVVGCQMVSATDGSAFTGSVTVSVTGDAGVQATGSVGSGACTHEGNGFHTYAPAQAETNYNHVAFTFTGTGAIPATVQIYTSFPQTGDSYAEVTSGTYGNSALKTLIDTLDNFVDTEVQAIYDRLGAPAGASVSADIAAVKVDTAAILADTGTDGVVVAAGSKTGYSLAAGGAGSGAIAAAELNNIADAVLDRNMATGVDSGSTTVRTPRQALRAVRNKVAISAGTATIYKEDDATSSWTAAVTTTAGDPISAVDPAGP